MQSLREFFASSSGLVPARQGLALGWVISALTWIAVLLGGKEAEAGCTSGPRYVGCTYDPDCPVDKPIGCWLVHQRSDCSRIYVNWVCTL